MERQGNLVQKSDKAYIFSVLADALRMSKLSGRVNFQMEYSLNLAQYPPPYSKIDLIVCVDMRAILFASSLGSTSMFCWSVLDRSASHLLMMGDYLRARMMARLMESAGACGCSFADSKGLFQFNWIRWSVEKNTASQAVFPKVERGFSEGRW